MSWHYLQEQEEAFWEGTCLDGAPSALLSLMPTPEASSSRDSGMDAFRDSQYGTTSEPSTATRGEATLTSSLEGFPAKISAPQERVLESAESDPGCGAKWRESSARYDRATCGWKTHLCLWIEDLPWSSVTLPKWGMMRDGVLWERITPEPRTSGTGAGFLPTPMTVAVSTDKAEQTYHQDINRVGHPTWQAVLAVAARMWPTPRAGNPGSRPNGKGGKILAEEVEIAEGLRVRMFPTPVASDDRPRATEASVARRRQLGKQISLEAEVKFPTPRSRDWKDGGTVPPSRMEDPGKDTLGQNIARTNSGGQLNPNWVEWLMGWPLGWTSMEPMPSETWDAWRRAFQSDPIACDASGTDRFRLHSSRHGTSCNEGLAWMDVDTSPTSAT